jgi:peptide/nickel transport system permease protein
LARLIAARCLTSIPLLFIASVLIFLLIYLVPGSPVVAVLGDTASPEAITQAEARLGLDRPLFEQYSSWVGHMITGDMGVSLLDGTPVAEIVGTRAVPTLGLAFLGVVISLLIGVPAGITAAIRPNATFDRTISILASIGLALPTFWLALLLMLLLSVQLKWFPVAGYTPLSIDPKEWLRSLVMPALALGITSGAVIALQTRSAMIEVLEAPYVQTLRAMGLRRRTILLSFALKNAMIPVLTVIGFQISHAIGGSIIMETVFALPGLGAALVNAVITKDFPVVRAITMVTAVGMVLVYCLVDVAYGVLDPRARQ